jgi:predicted phage baseplate assembly protein
MPLEVPNLDDRRWADLVEDARALIPRVAPRWTDHNVHDPGITFIELFAWLAEMQIYQLNRVGEQHREVFARLAGVLRRRRTPARVEVLVVGDLTTSMSLPGETQIVPLEGDEIVFETTIEVTLTRSRLRRVVVDDGSGPVDQTEANEKFGIAFLAFGERAHADAQLQLGFDRLYPSEERTIRLSIDVLTADLGVRCGPERPAPANGGEDETGAQPVDLLWEYLGPGARWLPLTLVEDETAALSRSGAVTLFLPNDAQEKRQHVWIRARIRRGYYDIEPRVRHIGVNGLSCIQRETVRNELLDRGNGRPNQSFELSKGPILVPEKEPPVIIEVGNEPWLLVKSFDEAGPDSKQYVFDVDSRRVLFGNGVNGKVPMPGQDIRARRYRASVGRAGNVAKDLPWKFRTAVVPGVTLRNPQPATGGSDPESLNDLELRAQASLSRPQRAVTLDDIERLALGTPRVYVARVAAIPDCPAPEQITVVVMPKVRPGRQGPPFPPSDAFLAAVRRHLQQRRLLCDNLRVLGPIYLEVSVSAQLRLTKGAGPAAVIERARRALDRFLAGDDQDSVSEPSADGLTLLSPCPTRWPFGRAVYPSEVYAVLDGVAGVDAVSRLTLRANRDDRPIAPDATGAVPVPRIGLIVSGRHDLTVESDVRRNG